jgi:PAS domain-containing protein
MVFIIGDCLVYWMISYLCERRHKREFILRYNETYTKTELRATVDALPDGAIVLSGDHKIVLWNS